MVFGYLEESAAFAQAAQPRYPPLLEDVQMIARPIEAKEEEPNNNSGTLGSLAENISWLLTATWHLEPNRYSILCWGELCSLQDSCICLFHLDPFRISESQPNRWLVCLMLTCLSVQKLACQFHCESSVSQLRQQASEMRNALWSLIQER